MIEIYLDVGDLADTRFGMSPLQETVLSLRAARSPGRHALHLPWTRSARPVLDGLHDGLLLSLVGPHNWIPDFLTPRPSGLLTDIGPELEQIRRTPPAVVAADIATAHWGAVPERLRGDPERVRDRIADLLEEYWRRAMAPHWPRMRSLLEADTVHRARSLALGGARALFADLHTNVEWRDGILRVVAGRAIHNHVHVSGQGLLLVPSVFAHKAMGPIAEDAPPMVIYPARGVATLWETASPRPPGAVAALIGAPKAAILMELDGPASTTELAHRLAVTPGAVSQHLRVLADAGLVTRARSGRAVLYARSPLADRLIAP
ncbi:ArsR/SmtB family transcription factor [Bailinhaonella thermotolerans]|uniref:ArsR family transcriptional regulator n=1 Tax=Bailinhaonella thermotolerans TaxID=1070861 RepID=A0A3A4AVQ3_9ACTN|nr:DUF5937 family protein [Bailinhaonella thermotolerans]RJL30137.1 ArsR family transcriptional regulator [Bailinhaonella thermotolerans]